MVWRAFAARAALPLATAAPLLFASRAARSDAIVEAADGPAPPTKGKRKAEIPEYFEPKLPYPAWDTDWDGLRHTRAKRKDGPPARLSERSASKLAFAPTRGRGAAAGETWMVRGRIAATPRPPSGHSAEARRRERTPRRDAAVPSPRCRRG